MDMLAQVDYMKRANSPMDYMLAHAQLQHCFFTKNCIFFNPRDIQQHKEKNLRNNKYASNIEGI